VSKAQYVLVLDGHICDVDTDGEIITKGSKEQMRRLADSLMEDYPMIWEVVPLEEALQKYPPHPCGQLHRE
jgi:hypothetical protein